MSKQQSGAKKRAKGGSPKKQIKRLRRKAIATLRQARLTAQLELVAAEAAAAQIRERALAAGGRRDRAGRAPRPTPRWRARSSRVGSMPPTPRSSTAPPQKPKRARVLAEAELKASRIMSDAESEARTRRDQIIAEAMQEAAAIRSAATEEIAGFLTPPRRRAGATARDRARGSGAASSPTRVQRPPPTRRGCATRPNRS